MNKPGNIPNKNWYNKDTGCGIDQSWFSYTPENLTKAQRNKKFTTKWILVGNSSDADTQGKDINAFQIQNAGYDFSSVKAGSDVISVDHKSGKITGVKKGIAYVTVCYKEYHTTDLIQYNILQAAKIKNDDLHQSEYDKIESSKNFAKLNSFYGNQYSEMMKVGEDAFTRVKFYRTFKVTVK